MTRTSRQEIRVERNDHVGLIEFVHRVHRLAECEPRAFANRIAATIAAAQAHGIDPTLVLAVAAVESKFRSGAVNPATGAAGLMQIMPKWHRDQILGVGGEPSLMLIAPNLTVGATILAEYLDAEGGDVNDALGRYLGTAGADRYVKRVDVERAHLTRVLKAG